MALVTPSSAVNVDATTASRTPPLAGLYAGEALLAAAPCYIKGSDGKVYQSNGTAANAAAKVHGFTPVAYGSGDPVTLMAPGTVFEYSTGMTPGAALYVGATAGRLDTATTTGDTAGCAIAITATKIRFVRVLI